MCASPQFGAQRNDILGLLHIEADAGMDLLVFQEAHAPLLLVILRSSRFEVSVKRSALVLHIPPLFDALKFDCAAHTRPKIVPFLPQDKARLRG